MHIVRWRALLIVLKEGWPLWVAVGGAILAFTMSWLVSTTLASTIRYTGMVLQLFGLFTIARGLSELRRLFGRPPLISRVVGWFGRFLAVFAPPQTISAHVSGSGGATASGHARVTTSPGLRASVEERLYALEEKAKQLRNDLDNEVQGLRREIDVVRERIGQESQHRRVGDQEAERKIEEVAIGGLHLEIVGLLWLFLGVVGTSIPDEIAAWL